MSIFKTSSMSYILIEPKCVPSKTPYVLKYDSKFFHNEITLFSTI